MSQHLDADTGSTGSAGALEHQQHAAPRSRRSIMTGTMAAGAGIATGLMFRAQSAAAATGDSLVLGEANFASSATSLVNDGESSSAGDGLDVSAGQGNGVAGTTSSAGMSGVLGTDGNTRPASGFGVSGQSDIGTGVAGNSNIGPGVSGTSPDGPGVVGTSTNAVGVVGTSIVDNGVQGTTANEGQSGVRGIDGNTRPASGFGVSGQSTIGTGVSGNSSSGPGVTGFSTSGIGVQAASPSGTALQVEGVAAFSRSGVASVPAGRTSVTVTLAGVTASSLVLATLQLQSPIPGKPTWILAAQPGTGSFTIYLSASSRVALPVAWIVFEHAAASSAAALRHPTIPRELPLRKQQRPGNPKQPPPTTLHRPRLHPSLPQHPARETPAAEPTSAPPAHRP